VRLLQILRDRRELFQRGFQVGGDLGGDHVGRRQVGGFLQRLVLQPEDVEVELVAPGQFFLVEAYEALAPRLPSSSRVWRSCVSRSSPSRFNSVGHPNSFGIAEGVSNAA
jgi:hypothetical protein